jgi:seryl-tRNA synthetase
MRIQYGEKMLDLKVIRENPEQVKEGIRNKNEKDSIDEILELDKKRRSIISEVDELKAKRNTVSKQVGQIKKAAVMLWKYWLK